MTVKLNLITFSKNADCAFTESGFKYWKKATDHERSNTHREAQLKYTAYIQNKDVRARLLEQHHLANKQVEVHVCPRTLKNVEGRGQTQKNTMDVHRCRPSNYEYMA